MSKGVLAATDAAALQKSSISPDFQHEAPLSSRGEVHELDLEANASRCLMFDMLAHDCLLWQPAVRATRHSFVEKPAYTGLSFCSICGCVA